MRTLNRSYLNPDTEAISALLSRTSLPLEKQEDLDPLMEYIGDAKYVLLGEASHGTHEYYAWRMKITQRLLREKNFSFVAVEGDWPDCYRANRYAKNYPHAGKSALEVLHSFNRWPTWMWGNWEMVAFIEWLKEFNKNRSSDKRVGFYGLDVYSLWESMDAIIKYLEKNDRHALEIAKQAVKCFEPFGYDEGQSYARASVMVPELCEKEVVDLLSEIRKNISHYNSDAENVFSTEQNALIAVHAEEYYRAMIHGGPNSWNIRDRHMVSTLDRLMKFHEKNSKAIIWEHNTHIGDARATDMASEGMVNVGELVAQQHAKDGVVAIGFGSYQGSVIAGRSWGDVMRKIPVPKAVNGSWEQIFHQAGDGKDKLLLMDKIKNEECLSTHIGHRAIGVVYNPEHEMYGNYVPSIMPMRYNAFIFLDETKGLHPLHIKPDGHQVPETYPFGM
jgi:erythromycin esterase-like protein